MTPYTIPKSNGRGSRAEFNLAPGCSAHRSDRAGRVSGRWLALMVLVILSGATAMPVASARASGRYPYRLVVPGTLGGPSSYLDEPGIPLTSDGTLIGAADTPTRNKAYEAACRSHLCSDGYAQRAFAWRNGKLTDLGVLPGWSGSMVNQLNSHGVGAGSVERGFGPSMPAGNRLGHARGVAALFKHGRVIKLGTLPGGSSSFAQNIDNGGQVAGDSNNAIKDPFSRGTETRVFVWKNGVMKDIGTLGGPNAEISWQNDKGQIAGTSDTDYTPDPANYGAPGSGAFLWQHGKMIDLGNLGGTVTNANWINDRGEVVGESSLAGDKLFRPFVWTNGRMRSLGSLGGSFAGAKYISRQGDIIGFSSLPGDKHDDAVLWRKGKKIPLPRVGGAPLAIGVRVNNHGDAVGLEQNAHRHDIMATLWTPDRRGYDLNKLIAPSNLRLIAADSITDNGDIVGHGEYTSGPRKGDARIFLLIRNPAVPLPPAVSVVGQASGVAAQSSAVACKGPTAQPPNRGSQDVLYAVAATPGCKAWAVGNYLKDGRTRTLIEYWNGKAWTVQKSPNPGRYGDGLNGVTAASTANVWAVGYYDTGRHGHPRRTLILHWNGKAWKAYKSPTPGTRFGDSSNQGLNGAAAPPSSPTNAWAVGAAQYPRVGDQPLIEHWNGRVWKVQKSPRFAPAQDCCYGQGLNDVGATSPANAWAVGYINNGDGYGPHGLIEHWNGRVWKADITGDFSQVYGLAPISRTNAWAIGTYAVDYCGSSGCTSYSNGVIDRWNGHAWKLQESPEPGRFNQLRAVAQTSPTNAWTVGYYCHGTNRGCTTTDRTLIEHWNGGAWTIRKSPNPGGASTDTRLYSVTAASRTDAWAVGSTGRRALAVHWNGTAWKG